MHPGQSNIPIIIDIPHSGRDYPNDFNYALGDLDMKKAEDRFVDLLIEPAHRLGIAMVIANFPRTYIDPNRPIDDLDPDVIEDFVKLNKPVSDHSKRGIGLIRRLVKGKELYKKKLSLEEVERRIETCYKPYHAAIEELISDRLQINGQVWHINLHSMPNDAAPPISSATPLNIFTKKADFEIGDRDGKTCDPAFSKYVYQYLQKKDYSIVSNVYYKGVEIVGRYGQPDNGIHSLQLEINKSLYLNERTQEKGKHFSEIEDILFELCENLIPWCEDQR